jgi:hypothetical protein
MAASRALSMGRLVRIAHQQVAVAAHRVFAGGFGQRELALARLDRSALLGTHARGDHHALRAVLVEHALLAVQAFGDQAIGGQPLAMAVRAGVDVPGGSFVWACTPPMLPAHTTRPASASIDQGIGRRGGQVAIEGHFSMGNSGKGGKTTPPSSS